MIRKMTAAFVAAIMVFSLSASSVVFANGDVKKRYRANPLVALLPQSDVVITADGKRFFGDALPKALAANTKALNDVFAKIDSMQAKTGIDLRKFDSIAAGANVTSVAGGKFRVAPVVIARGTVRSFSIIEAAKKAAENRFREDTVNGRTIFILSAQDAAELARKNSTVATDPAATVASDKVISEDVAIAVVDGNTVVFGFAERVIEMLGSKSKVSAALTGMLGRKPAGVVNFAGKMPGGMSSLLPLENDELGNSIDSIKAMYGAMDIFNSTATISVTAVTSKAEQAAELKGTLEGLKDLGTSILGISKAADKKLYAKLLGSVKLANVSNELNLDLAIPQNDLDSLIAILKK